MTAERNLGSVLKKTREDAGLSQGDVARKLGYKSPQFISDWERGLSYPPLNKVSVMAKILKMPDQELFNLMLADAKLRLEESWRKDFERGRKRRKV